MGWVRHNVPELRRGPDNEERNAVEQLAIAVTGCVAIWLANDQRETWRKWASVFGLAGQPFWFYSAVAAEQWGILALTFVYTASWARGFRNNWMRSNGGVEGAARLCAQLPSNEMLGAVRPGKGEK